MVGKPRKTSDPYENSSLPSNRQPISQYPWSSSSATLPLSFIAEHDVIWYGSAGVSWPSSVSFHLFMHPQTTLWWGEVKSRKGLDTM